MASRPLPDSLGMITHYRGRLPCQTRVRGETAHYDSGFYLERPAITTQLVAIGNYYVIFCKTCQRNRLRSLHILDVSEDKNVWRSDITVSRRINEMDRVSEFPMQHYLCKKDEDTLVVISGNQTIEFIEVSERGFKTMCCVDLSAEAQQILKSDKLVIDTAFFGSEHDLYIIGHEDQCTIEFIFAHIQFNKEVTDIKDVQALSHELPKYKYSGHFVRGNTLIVVSKASFAVIDMLSGTMMNTGNHKNNLQFGLYTAWNSGREDERLVCYDTDPHSVRMYQLSVRRVPAGTGEWQVFCAQCPFPLYEEANKRSLACTDKHDNLVFFCVITGYFLRSDIVNEDDDSDEELEGFEGFGQHLAERSRGNHLYGLMNDLYRSFAKRPRQVEVRIPQPQQAG